MGIKHRIENQAFEIDVRTTSAANDVAELRSLDVLAPALETVEDQTGCCEVEPLS